MKHLFSDFAEFAGSCRRSGTPIKISLALCLITLFSLPGHAARQDTIRAWNNSGFAAYEAGLNDKAAQLFRKAAEAGDASAKYNLAVMHIRSETRSITRSRAISWLQHSADAGFAQAQFMLAELMESGDFAGVIKRPRKSSVQYLELAANQGHPEAAHAMGLKYLLGRGIEQSDERAAHFYSLAANAGDVASQYTLASLYERGAGVTRDLQLALQWYAAAARQGDVAAREKAKFLADEIARERKS